MKTSTSLLTLHCHSMGEKSAQQGRRRPGETKYNPDVEPTKDSIWTRSNLSKQILEK